MNRTKIDWCDYTWNPVWGCRNSCPYCYARKLAHRFGRSFEPHWREKNFQRPMPRKPSWIFVNSMSEIAYWERPWLERVLQRIRENPQHTFLFLTKSPGIYLAPRRPWPKNCWLGATATTAEEVSLAQELLLPLENVTFLSIEPILERIPPGLIRKEAINWLILGAETGNRGEKVIPRREWILALVIFSVVPIFMKASLAQLWEKRLIQEFPA